MNKTQSNIHSNLPILPELQLNVNVFRKKKGQKIQRGPSHETVMIRHCDYNWSWQNFPVENLNYCPYHHFLNFRNYCFHTHWHYNFFFYILLCKTPQALPGCLGIRHELLSSSSPCKFLIAMRSRLGLANWKHSLSCP